MKTSLLLAELPLADRTKPDVAGLRNHLSLLAQDGLQLCIAENGKLPDWNFVIDPAGARCRAIQIDGTDRCLNMQVGAGGLVTTIEPAAVKSIAEATRNTSHRIVKPEELEFPPNVRVIHIRDGERVTEADLFGNVFRSPLKSLYINDRFLRSDHHEKRIRAYLNLISGQPGMRPQIRIETLAAEINMSRQVYYYQTSSDQKRMFARLSKDFPAFDIQYQLAQRLPHDRFIHLVRADGSEARIGLGAGLDFIRFNGRTCMTDIVIEDPINF